LCLFFGGGRWFVCNTSNDYNWQSIIKKYKNPKFLGKKNPKKIGAIRVVHLREIKKLLLEPKNQLQVKLKHYLLKYIVY